MRPKKIVPNLRDLKNLKASFLLNIILSTNFKVIVKHSNFYKEEKVRAVVTKESLLYSSSAKHDLGD